MKLSLSRPLFISILLALAAIKLVLVSQHEIVAADRPHDDLWQIIAAANWYWRRPFDEWTLMHLPVYPIYIACVRLTGIPLRIAIELTYLAAAIVLVLSLGRLRVSRLLQVAGFALIAFHPRSYTTFDFALAELLFACLMLLMVGLFIYAITAKSRFETWTGGVLFSLTVALMWFCRKESVLLGGAIAMIGIAVIVLLLLRRMDREHAIISFVSLVALPAATIAIMGAMICTANFMVYGVWRTDILTGGNLAGAYKAMILIDGGPSPREIMVNTRARELAYTVSPAFAELRPILEDKQSYWKNGTKESTGLDDEIAAGWFHWALISAAASKGHFTSAPQAEEYFGRIAKEIETALDDGRLPRRSLFTAYLSQWPAVYPNSLLRVLRQLLSKPSANLPEIPLHPSAATKAAFDTMANRRAALSMPPTPGGTLNQILNQVHSAIDAIYLAVLVAAAVMALIGLLWRRPSLYCAMGAALFFMLVLIGSRVIFFALLDAAAWNGTQARYLFPIEPLIVLFPVMAFGLAMTGNSPPGWHRAFFLRASSTRQPTG